jgi:hypothetical protein
MARRGPHASPFVLANGRPTSMRWMRAMSRRRVDPLRAPGMPRYDATRAGEVLCTGADARAAGHRRAIVEWRFTVLVAAFGPFLPLEFNAERLPFRVRLPTSG